MADQGRTESPERVDYMLTTRDNPYNPFDQFDLWWTWDELHGYHTSGILAKLIRTSSELPDWMQNEDRLLAIDEIVEMDETNTFKKVARTDFVVAHQVDMDSDVRIVDPAPGGEGVSQTYPPSTSPGSLS